MNFLSENCLLLHFNASCRLGRKLGSCSLKCEPRCNKCKCRFQIQATFKRRQYKNRKGHQIGTGPLVNPALETRDGH